MRLFSLLYVLLVSAFGNVLLFDADRGESTLNAEDVLQTTTPWLFDDVIHEEVSIGTLMMNFNPTLSNPGSYSDTRDDGTAGAVTLSSDLALPGRVSTALAWKGTEIRKSVVETTEPVFSSQGPNSEYASDVGTGGATPHSQNAKLRHTSDMETTEATPATQTTPTPINLETTENTSDLPRSPDMTPAVPKQQTTESDKETEYAMATTFSSHQGHSTDFDNFTGISFGEIDSSTVPYEDHSADESTEQVPRTGGQGQRGQPLKAISKFRSAFAAVSLVVDGVGIVLNAVSLAVFSRMSPSVPNIYFMSLTVLDIIALAANIPYSAMDLITAPEFRFPVAYMYFRLYFELPVQQGVRYASSLMTSILTLDRFSAVALTMQTTKKGVSKVPTVLTVCVTIFSIASRAATLAFTWQIVEVNHPETKSTHGIILISPTFIENKELINGLNLAGDTLFRYLPCLVIVAANIGLLAKLVNHKRNMKRLCRGGKSSTTSKSRSNSPFKSVIVVLAYSSVYLIFALPILVFRVINVVRPELSRLQPVDYLILKSSLPSLTVLSGGVDFLVYYAASSQFRHVLKSLVLGRNMEQPSLRSSSARSQARGGDSSDRKTGSTDSVAGTDGDGNQGSVSVFTVEGTD